MRLFPSLTLPLAALVLAASAFSPAGAATWQVTVDPTFRKITISWDAVANADHYLVCIATVAIADPKLCASYTGGGLPKDTTRRAIGFTKLTNGVAYHLRAVAVDASGNTVADSGDRLSIPRAQALNDTGITRCATKGEVDKRCPLGNYPGQDGDWGRDVTQNKKTNGHAGFSFTKISASGQALPASATAWDCVRDNVTGLMWEMKTDDGGLHDKDWRYTWYEPVASKNGGAAGTRNGGSCKGRACDTYGYVSAVNKASWCGHRDWRLPTRMELLSIVSLNRFGPVIDTAYFPNTSFSYHWSSSPVAHNRDTAWVVHFDYGHGMWNDKYDDRCVRLVRSGQ